MDGHLPRTIIGYAWPLVDAPLACLAGPSFLAALPWLLALQFLVLCPVALLRVYAHRDARIGGRLFGHWAAALWVAAPYPRDPALRRPLPRRFAEQFLPQALGLSALADFPSMVALLLAAWLAPPRARRRGRRAGVLAGLAAGFAIGSSRRTCLFLAGPRSRARARPALAARALVRRRRSPPRASRSAIWKGRGPRRRCRSSRLDSSLSARLRDAPPLAFVVGPPSIDLAWAP